MRRPAPCCCRSTRSPSGPSTRLLELAQQPSVDLAALGHQSRHTIDTALQEEPAKKGPADVDWDSEYLVLVKCGDERQQIELLDRFLREGLDCKALSS